MLFENNENNHKGALAHLKKECTRFSFEAFLAFGCRHNLPLNDGVSGQPGHLQANQEWRRVTKIKAKENVTDNLLAEFIKK